MVKNKRQQKGYSLQGNRKTDERSNHIDRNANLITLMILQKIYCNYSAQPQFG